MRSHTGLAYVSQRQSRDRVRRRGAHDREGAPVDGSSWARAKAASDSVTRSGCYFDLPGLCRGTNRFRVPPATRGEAATVRRSKSDVRG